MFLAEVFSNNAPKDDAPLLFHILQKLLKKHTVYMTYHSTRGTHDVEIDDVWGGGNDVIVYFGVPNERTGDISHNNWHDEYLDADAWTVTKNNNGEWWLHEIE